MNVLELPAVSGTYVLVLRGLENRRISVGRWGELDLDTGYYAYVGSAFGSGGLKARVGRHGRRTKKLRWHVDYLREHCDLAAVWYCRDAVRREHRWAAALAGLDGYTPVKGFGCSDCRCEAHLFHGDREPDAGAFGRTAGGVVEVVDRCDPD